MTDSYDDVFRAKLAATAPDGPVNPAAEACLFGPPHEPFYCRIHADVRLTLSDEHCRKGAMTDTPTTAAHPEAFCQRCKEPNPVWWARNDLWNAVMGSPNGIVCPSCFAELAVTRALDALDLDGLTKDLRYIDRTLDRVLRLPNDGHIPLWAREDRATIARLLARIEQAKGVEPIDPEIQAEAEAALARYREQAKGAEPEWDPRRDVGNRPSGHPDFGKG